VTALYPPGGFVASPPVAPDDRLARIEAQLDQLLADGRRRDAELDVVRDVAADLGLMATPTVAALTAQLGVLEERGYLDFARGGVGVLDRVVTSFGEDDVRALGDNIVLMLQTLKDLTQPEILQLLRRTADAAQAHDHDPGSDAPPSTIALLKQLRDPEVRRGLHRLLEVVRSLGQDASASAPHDITT
jgi:uncharacterized protein YjgD (DUF1641 family)